MRKFIPQKTVPRFFFSGKLSLDGTAGQSVLKLRSLKEASHAGVFRGARISSLGRDKIQAPLKTLAWEASLKVIR